MTAYPGGQNQTGAKEAGKLLSKPFKLEQALYTKVKEHEEAEAENLRPKSNREKKAVDFFLRRRIRCDKYVKETVAPELPELSEEELRAQEEERLRQEYLERQKALNVEIVEVTPIQGELKMAPLNGVNPNNSGNTATPFGSNRNSAANSQAWSSVKFGSVSEPVLGTGMMNSVMSSLNGSNSIFDTAASTPFYGAPAQKYRPVNFMNFKSKQKAQAGVYVPGQNSANPKLDKDVEDLLKSVQEKESESRRQAEAREQAAQAKAAKKRYGFAATKKATGEGPEKIGLSKVSLPPTTGKWRPSNDNWKPGVNTDGFFTALAALNEKKEANKGKKVVYGENSYKPSARSFADNSLASALTSL